MLVNGNTVKLTNINGFERDIFSNLDIEIDGKKIGELGLEKGTKRVISYEIPINNCEVSIEIRTQYKKASHSRYTPGARISIAQIYVSDNDICEFKKSHWKTSIKILSGSL